LGSEVRIFRKSVGRSCATPPEIALIIRLLAQLDRRGGETWFDNAQPWAGTLTQRHGRLIGSRTHRVESWPRPSPGAGGLWNDGPGPGAASLRA
jgi:hypothetical protein